MASKEKPKPSTSKAPAKTKPPKPLTRKTSSTRGSGTKKTPQKVRPRPLKPTKWIETKGKDHETTMPGEVPAEKQAVAVATNNRELEGDPTEDPVMEEALAQQEELDFATEILRVPTPEKPEPLPDQYDFDDRDFDDLDPNEYGIEFDEEDEPYLSPYRDETLPDLYRLMDALETGKTDLDTVDEPPSLFTRPEHVPNYKKISELKLELEEEDIQPYVENFEDEVRDDVLMIGSIKLEDVQEEEHRLRDEHIAYREQEARLARQRRQEIVLREEEAKRQVARDLKNKRRLLQRREELLQQKERLMIDRLHKSFRRAENQLLSILNRRKGEVKTMFGDLTLADGQYGGSKGRRWKVDWNKTPQPVQVKLKTLRGVKDKLPAGRYVLMVSLYNRLGGHVMRWSNLKGQMWGGTTLPLSHDGHFYNAEIKIDQSVFTVLPSMPSIRPGMVLVFELFLLRGAVMATDRVVAWGAFPIADATFDVVEGKFKCPFLRGEMDSLIENHSTMEELMSDDMDHWLGNLYIEIIRLPRYLAGQKEYEVELQFSSSILTYPDRYNTGGEEYRDGEAPVPGSLPSLRDAVEREDTPASHPSEEFPGPSDSQGRTPSIDSADVHKPGLPPDTKPRPLSTASHRSSFSFGLSGKKPITNGKKVRMGDDSDSDEYDEEDVEERKRDKGFFPVKGEAGIYYKQYKTNAVDDYHKKLYALLPRTALLTNRRRRKRLTYIEELEEHNFSVKEPFSDKGHVEEEGNEKMQYVARQMLAELGLSQWRSREFWIMIFMFIFTFFMRLFIHYIGQWMYLQGRKIPINKFTFYPYTVQLNYQPSLLTMADETLVVMLGPLTNVFILAFFIVVCWVVQKLLGQFPDIGCKLVLGYSIMTFLDPFLILIVDASLQRWQDVGGDVPIGDFAKLYWHFERTQGSGLAGVFITIFLYCFTCFAAAAMLYMYFLRLHNNGRMLDVFWRLHGEEDLFFVPYDLELSNHELAYIVKKAEQWRGEEGERRKVAVYDYIWEEEPVEEVIWDEDGNETVETKQGKTEVTTHVSIHTLHLDGLRELYRHFLRLPDGAIVEVFGDMAVSGMDKDMKNALDEGAQTLEKKTETPAAPKVRGRETALTSAGFHLDMEGTSSDMKKPLPLGSMESLKKDK